jgi:hypothetical protein
MRRPRKLSFPPSKARKFDVQVSKGVKGWRVAFGCVFPGGSARTMVKAFRKYEDAIQWIGCRFPIEEPKPANPLRVPRPQAAQGVRGKQAA